MKRLTATLPPQLEHEIKEAASLSGMSVSGYLQQVLTSGFPAGLPRFGMAMITPDGKISPVLPQEEETRMTA